MVLIKVFYIKKLLTFVIF